MPCCYSTSCSHNKRRPAPANSGPTGHFADLSGNWAEQHGAYTIVITNNKDKCCYTFKLLNLNGVSLGAVKAREQNVRITNLPAPHNKLQRGLYVKDWRIWGYGWAPSSFHSAGGNYGTIIFTNSAVWKRVKWTCGNPCGYICKNGTAASNAPCSKDGTEKCASCDANYKKGGDGCVPDNTCRCEKGTPVANSSCTVHNAEQCTSCTGNYRLLTGRRGMHMWAGTCNSERSKPVTCAKGQEPVPDWQPNKLGIERSGHHNKTGPRPNITTKESCLMAVRMRNANGWVAAEWQVHPTAKPNGLCVLYRGKKTPFVEPPTRSYPAQKGRWKVDFVGKTPTACSQCAAGQYSSADNATPCQDCTAGTWSSSGQAGCNWCSAGYPARAGKGTTINCEGPCPVGTYARRGATTCRVCSPPFITDTGTSTGATKCTRACIPARHQPGITILKNTTQGWVNLAQVPQQGTLPKGVFTQDDIDDGKIKIQIKKGYYLRDPENFRLSVNQTPNVHCLTMKDNQVGSPIKPCVGGETSNLSHPRRKRCKSYAPSTCHSKLVMKHSVLSGRNQWFTYFRNCSDKKNKLTCEKTIANQNRTCKWDDTDNKCKEDLTGIVVRPQICTEAAQGYYLEKEDDWERKYKKDECSFVNKNAVWNCHNMFQKAAAAAAAAAGTVTIGAAVR
jgi:hypothetical protein